MKMKVPLYLLILCVFAMLPLSIYAESFSIKNSVSVSSNSGGNSVSKGEVIEGKSTSRVFIETIHNGEVVQYIDEVREDGEPLIIESSYANDGQSVVVDVTSDTRDQPELENYAIEDAFSHEEREDLSKVVEEHLKEIQEQVEEALITSGDLLEDGTSVVGNRVEEEQSSVENKKAAINGLFSKLLSYVFILFRI